MCDLTLRKNKSMVLQRNNNLIHKLDVVTCRNALLIHHHTMLLAFSAHCLLLLLHGVCLEHFDACW